VLPEFLVASSLAATNEVRVVKELRLEMRHSACHRGSRGLLLNRLAVCGGMCLFAIPVFAELGEHEVRRLSQATNVITELRVGPHWDVPQELWIRAQCVLVIPSMKKAAFLLGGEMGDGVMTCRHASGWSAPVFMHLAKGSIGVQIVAEQIDLVLLVTNRRGVNQLLQNKVSLGVDVSIAAGPVSRSAHAATDAQLTAHMLSYSRSYGLFVGIDLSGGVLRPDTAADGRAYGPGVTPLEIVHGRRKVVMPAAAGSFVRAVARTVALASGQR
jgi:SH3 domain-containing YSC84-like protein 1